MTTTPRVEHLCGVVVHPAKPRSAQALAALRRATRRRGWPEPLVAETTVEVPGADQVAELLTAGADRIVALGGDGTVREVAGALSRAGALADVVPLGVLPTGTANLWSRTVGLTDDSLEGAVELALDGPVRDCDLAWVTVTRADGSARTHDVAVVAGVGMDAEAFAATADDHKQRLGWLAYFAALGRRAVGRQVTVRLGLGSVSGTGSGAGDGSEAGTTREEQVRTVLVGNCRVLPLGLPLMPSASMEDGRLDVLVVAPRTVLGWLGVGAGILTRRRGGWTGLRTHRARHVTVDLAEPTAVHVDGDPVGDAVRLELGVRPGAVLVRTRAGARDGEDEVRRLLDAPEPDLEALADALHHGRRWSSDHARELLVRDVFVGLSGADLTRFKSLLSSGPDHRDLEHLVFDVVDDEGVRADILRHIASEAERVDVPDLHVLSDIDDTLRCALHDDRYPRGTVYPGVIELYRALDAGHAADPESPGDITFVTARPMDPAGLVEQHTRRGLRELGLPPHSVLSGTFTGLRNHDAMAGAKIENFRRFRALMPETEVVFVGDSGQGDVEVGRRMIAADRDAVRLVLIHDVVDTPEAARDELRAEGIVLVDSPVGGALEAYAVDLVSAAGLEAVVTAAERDLDRIEWESPEQEKATRAVVERDIAAARTAYGKAPDGSRAVGDA
ncbi:diacylglycerol kinase family protein [Knoellia flava]|uniref:diacylglycerol kinase family protein n=1 Tax=Knoellia flava TaxID=913969 RepID=UPI0016647D72|nr:diacylglycerol kinase family protein [Knoellia flava]